MPTSVRLDAKTERMVERLARERGITKSAVIRDAIANAAKKQPQEGSMRPYDRVKHLIGSVSGLPPNLSENTHEKVRQILLTRKRAR